MAGKVEWLVNQRPVEGEHDAVPTVGQRARVDVVTCGLQTEVGSVRAQVEASPYPFALVLSEGGVLLGRLRRSSLAECDPRRTAAEVMEPGPSTVRPHKSAAGVARDLAERQLRWAIVTGADGRLIGVVSRSELEDGAAQAADSAG